MTFQLEIMARELRAALDIASTVTDHGIKVPILKCTRIEVNDGTVTFIATNTDHSIRASAAASGSGIVHLDTAMLAQKASALRQDQPVKLSGDEKFVTITQGKTRWRVPVIFGDDFPTRVVEEIVGNGVTISAAPLLAAIRAVIPVIESTDNRIIGQGPLFDTASGFRVVGAGKSGLNVVQMDDGGPSRDMIIPNGSVAAILSLFRDATSLDLHADEKAFTLSDGDILYRSKMIEGTYMEWRRALKQTEGNSLSVSIRSADLLEALNRATAIREDVNKSGRWVAVKVTFAGGECSVVATNKFSEEGLDICPCEGDDGTFGIASGVLQMGIESLGEEEIIISFSETESPVMLSPKNGNGRDNYRIVMPMRVA